MSDELLDEVERAVVHTPQPGDVVMFHLTRPTSMEAAERIRQQAREVFGDDVKLVMLDGVEFAGVVRPGQ